MNKFLALLGAASTAILLFLAMVFPKLAFLAWAALVPLLLMIGRSPSRQSFLAGWFGGTIFFILLLWWLGIPVYEYGGNARIPGLIGLLILFTVMGLSWGIFSYLAGVILRQRSISPLLALPVLWTGLEILRGLVFFHLPLGFLGYSQAPYPYVLQIADIFSLWGISFFLALLNTGIYYILIYPMSFKRTVLVVLAAVLCVFSYGHWQLQVPQEKIMDIGLVQGNIPQEERWVYALQDRNIGIHMDLSRKLTGQVDMLLWPESSIPIDPAWQRRAWEELSRDIRDLETPLFVGILTRENFNVYNGAFLILEGEIVDHYYKMWLAPFGEYIPFSSVFGWVDTGFAPTSPGEELRTFEFKEVEWASPICYEIYNSWLVRKMSRESDFLINISNEAWFKDSQGLYLLWSVGVLRAVEVRKPIIKAANTGYSGFVDDRGRQVVLFPTLEEHAEKVTVHSSGEEFSPYVLFGNWTILGLLILSLGLGRIMGPMKRRWGEQRIR